MTFDTCTIDRVRVRVRVRVRRVFVYGYSYDYDAQSSLHKGDLQNPTKLGFTKHPPTAEIEEAGLHRNRAPAPRQRHWGMPECPRDLACMCVWKSVAPPKI